MAIEANRQKGKIEVNSVRSIYYRTSNSHIANWINEGLLEYAIAIRAENKNGNLEVNEIASIHGKTAERFLSDMENAKEGGLKDALRYVDKTKALDWLGLSVLSTNQGLNDVAKIIKDFENTKLYIQKLYTFNYQRVM